MDSRGNQHGRGPRGDEYEMDSRGNQYGRGPRGDKYETDSRGNQYERGPHDNYGMDSRGDQYGKGPHDQHFDAGDGQGGQAVVSQQPGRMGFHDGPGTGVPFGLGYLAQVDQLLVQQKVEACEIFSGCETKNRYAVKNTLGQQVYRAKEDTGCCTRQCCGAIRPFDMQIFDTSDQEVLHLNRPLRCQGCCYPCCLQQLEVTASGGQVMGTIHQHWSLLRPKLFVHRFDGEHVFTIGGPICKCSLCGDVDFAITTADGEQEVGVIKKQWSGFCREFCTDSDNFGITFPMDLDVGLKATLFGALFLVDFMYFEMSK